MKVMEAVLSGDRATAGTPLLLGHHGVDPTLALFRCHVDGGLERFAFEALGVEDLANLIALAFRR